MGQNAVKAPALPLYSTIICNIAYHEYFLIFSPRDRLSYNILQSTWYTVSMDPRKQTAYQVPVGCKGKKKHFLDGVKK